MDRLLDDLGFDLQTRLLVPHQIRDSLAAEFHVEADFAHQLAARFRTERRGLERLLDPPVVPDSSLAAGLEVLRQHSRHLAPVVSQRQACARAGGLSVSLQELAGSSLHLHANRLLGSAHRAQELVLYEFLLRLYHLGGVRVTAGPAGLGVPGRSSVAGTTAPATPSGDQILGRDGCLGHGAPPVNLRARGHRVRGMSVLASRAPAAAAPGNLAHRAGGSAIRSVIPFPKPLVMELRSRAKSAADGSVILSRAPVPRWLVRSRSWRAFGLC